MSARLLMALTGIATRRGPLAVFLFAGPTGRVVDSVQLEIAGKQCSLSRLIDELYVARIYPFKTEAEARTFFPAVHAGLVLAAIKFHGALQVNTMFDNVTFSVDPEATARNCGHASGRIDGLVNSDQPAIYPVGKKISTAIMKYYGETEGVRWEDFFRAVESGMSAVRGGNVLDDQQLAIALDLYRAHHYETSREAQLLTLVMALEAMTQPQPKAPAALQLLEQWKSEIKTVIGHLPEDDEDNRESLEALQRELLFRETDSLSQQVRALVRRTLFAAGHTQTEDLAKRVKVVYNCRSSLSHEGRVKDSELDEALLDARHIVEEVLRSRLGVNQYTNVPS